MKRKIPLTALLLASTAVLPGQQYFISTIAGGAPIHTPVAALNAPLRQPLNVATDAAGNAYFNADNCVFKLDAKGVLTRVAGNFRPGYSGDGGPATSAQIAGAVAADAAGNLFLAGADRIRRIASDGIITTVAGNGTRGYSGDGGPATAAQMNSPFVAAPDTLGNLYIAEPFRIRRVSASGIISTFAGNGTDGYSGDGGPATSAQLKTFGGITVDGDGNLYVADFDSGYIRKVSRDGIITTKARLGHPLGLAADALGTLYVQDLSRIWKVAPNGIVTTAAGDGTIGNSGDGGPATSAKFYFYDCIDDIYISCDYSSGVAVDATGSVYVADSFNNRIRKVSADGIVSTVAGGAPLRSSDGSPASNARLESSSALTVDSSGNLYIAEADSIRKVSSNGIITTVAGNGTYGFPGEGVAATGAGLYYPADVAVDAAGNLYIADPRSNRIRKVAVGGIITTIAGIGTYGYSGDGGPATRAQLNEPYGVSVDAAGNLYIADTRNYRIRKVTPNGIITTVAGNGINGYSGDGGAATSAQVGSSVSIAVDGSGNLYIAEPDNFRIRKVSPVGIITTVAGNGTRGNSGDGGPAVGAQLNFPYWVSVDAAENLYISDTFNGRIRKVSRGGIITTIAGNGNRGYSGDGGPATSAQVSPRGVAVDAAGNVYFANDVIIRVLEPTGPAPFVGSVINAASNLAGPVAPGEIVTLYGSALGPPILERFPADDPGYNDAKAFGLGVRINGTTAPVLYASATQVAAIVPYSISGASAEISLERFGQTSAAAILPVAGSAPGLFTQDSSGQGQAAAFNQDGSLNSTANPARLGSFISIYGTGEGQTVPAGVDGKPASDPLPRPVLPVTVTIGGQQAQVQYAGSAPGLVGTLQINAQIPNGIQPGSAVPVAVKVGSVTSRSAVTIAVSGN